MRSILLDRDGDQIVATWDTFEDLQESPAGFGDTVKDAVLALFKDSDDLTTPTV